MSRVRIHVERLVLEGLDLRPGQREALAEALRAGLAAATWPRGLPAASQAAVPAAAVVGSGDPGALGADVARVVHGALVR